MLQFKNSLYKVNPVMIGSPIFPIFNTFIIVQPLN